jgi:hypothetical protein
MGNGKAKKYYMPSGGLSKEKAVSARSAKAVLGLKAGRFF